MHACREPEVQSTLAASASLTTTQWRRAFERPDQIASDSTAVEPAGLWDDGLVIDQASVHSAGVERNVIAGRFAGLARWIGYYNEERPHGAIGNKVPISLQNSGGKASPSS